MDIGGLYDLASIWVVGKYMRDGRGGSGVDRMIVYMLGTDLLARFGYCERGLTLKGRKSLRWHEG
jgi:hypothetical protein